MRSLGAGLCVDLARHRPEGDQPGREGDQDGGRQHLPLIFELFEGDGIPVIFCGMPLRLGQTFLNGPKLRAVGRAHLFLNKNYVLRF